MNYQPLLFSEGAHTHTIHNNSAHVCKKNISARQMNPIHNTCNPTCNLRKCIIFITHSIYGIYESCHEKTGNLHNVTNNSKAQIAMRLCYSDSTINSYSTFYFCLKFQASSHLLYLPVCVRPCQKPRRPVFLSRGF